MGEEERREPVLIASAHAHMSEGGDGRGGASGGNRGKRTLAELEAGLKSSTAASRTSSAVQGAYNPAIAGNTKANAKSKAFAENLESFYSDDDEDGDNGDEFEDRSGRAGGRSSKHNEEVEEDPFYAAVAAAVVGATAAATAATVFTLLSLLQLPKQLRLRQRLLPLAVYSCFVRRSILRCTTYRR